MVSESKVKPSQSEKVKKALEKLRDAALELANIVEEEEYEFKNAPEYLEDPDDFAYDLQSFVEDEIESLTEGTEEQTA